MAVSKKKAAVKSSSKKVSKAAKKTVVDKKAASKKAANVKKASKTAEKKVIAPKYYVSETPLKSADKEIFAAMKNEYKREVNGFELIASENIVSRAVMEAQGSIFTNKYAEGYPSKRYYGGCSEVDIVEDLARERAKKLFKAPFINVQPHSGSQANMGVYMAVLQPGDTCLGLSLDSGGHLTHGKNVNFSGKIYNFQHYNVNKETMQIDYDELRDTAKKLNPKLIVAGGSAYPRFIDFKKFREIADEVGALLMVDMAHIAGLVAAGVHPSPVPHAHFVTGTTHKTLRGPRGGYIISTEEDLAKKIDKTIFPGIQGGPLMHVIAAKAKGITGQLAETILDKAHITINKNGIPYDTESPMVTSGIRLGTPAITTRGLKEKDVMELTQYIDEVLSNSNDEKMINAVGKKVAALCKKFPMYKFIADM